METEGYIEYDEQDGRWDVPTDEPQKPVQVVIPYKEENEVSEAKYLLECVSVAYMDRDRNTLLHQCVPTRTPMAVYVYANAGIPVNFQNTAGETALHLAVQSGNLDLIRALLQCGANPLIRNKMGLTPFDFANKRSKPLCEQFEPGLVNAIERGNFGALKRLLRLHCSLDTVVKDDLTGLELARKLCDASPKHHKCYHRAAVEHLFTNRLVHKVKVQDHESVEKLLESGKVCVNSRYKDQLGRTPLTCALERKDSTLVHLLLKHGAVVDIRINEDDEQGPSMPLQHMVTGRSCPLDIVKAIADRAKNYITEKDSRGQTVLHKAIARNADLKTIEYLCTVHDHVLLYTRDAQGMVPRQLAVQMQRTPMVRVIDEVTKTLPLPTLLVMMVNFYGVENFNFDDEERTKMAEICEEKGRAQLNAAVAGDTDTVLALMRGDYRDQNGYTALIRAIACNRYETAYAMISQQHRLKTVPDNSNRYPLHYAYALPDNIGTPFVQLLLKENADAIEFQHDKDGYQPADYIKLRDTPQIQEMLHRGRTLDNTD